MGTPSYAEVILKKLLDQEDIEVVAVFTQADKAVGRKQVLTPPIVKVLAQEHNIKVYQPLKLRDAISDVLATECDYIVVAAYGQIVPKEIIDYRPCINLHASILPLYRGASPIQAALLNGDKQTGITSMLMDETLDTGDILEIAKVDIDPNAMQEELFAQLSDEAAKLTLKTLRDFKKITPKPQDNQAATYCKKITKQDGLIEFLDANEIYNKYRAFTPWPGIYLASALKIKKCALQEQTSTNVSGEILKIEKDYVLIGCKKGSLKIFSVQPESKKEMDIISYINGKRLRVADTLS